MNEDNISNESVDLFASFDTSPASPGMESLLQEQSEAAKNIPKNVRFNRAYDQTKVKAETLSKYNTERFLELMQAVKTISNSIRDGFPQELKIVPASNNVEPQTSPAS